MKSHIAKASTQTPQEVLGLFARAASTPGEGLDTSKKKTIMIIAAKREHQTRSS